MALPEIRLYNTLRRSVEILRPAEPGHVRMYVCGMTVYDHCHIGHARAMVTFDVVYRHLLHRGYRVTYVRNHTDVDDKILARAAEQGRDPLELSAFFISALERDLAALGLRAPTHQPRVSRHIPAIIELVGSLVGGGHAYAAGGDVYFSVQSCRRYGQLSGRRPEELFSGGRLEPNPLKRHPADFALWKASGEGEIGWDSPWGRGRPGWHIECSAMSMHHLGPTFDIHGGGIDLVFPHHENEIAQSECGTGRRPFARYWMHNGHLTMGRDKMSKSLGNIVRIRDLLREVPAESLRLLYLQTHYRSPLPYDVQRLGQATQSLDRLYRARELVERACARPSREDPGALAAKLGAHAARAWELARDAEARFDQAMDADFNTALALGGLFELVRAINRLSTDRRALERAGPLLAPARRAFEVAGEVLGIGGMEPARWFEQLRALRLAARGMDREHVEELVARRAAAREARDWATADSIRDQLASMGIDLMDGAGGTGWSVREEQEPPPSTEP